MQQSVHETVDCNAPPKLQEAMVAATPTGFESVDDADTGA